jgi:hypothetical protein
VKARRGDVIEAPEREVQVHAIELLEQQPERLRLRVTCGSGTYIAAWPATSAKAWAVVPTSARCAVCGSSRSASRPWSPWTSCGQWSRR